MAASRVDYGATGAINYTYDNAGNLLSRVTSATGGSGGVITSVNTAGGGSDIAQNTWIEIKGTNIAPASTPASGVIWGDAPDFAAGRLPTLLKGASATVNGKAAYVYFYCRGTVAPTTGKSFACIGGPGFSLSTPACGRIFSQHLS
jgi:hypothetical protein